jgi:hypothetical protein
MASADDESFVTVVVNSHGRELKHIKATREQNLTLRRLSMAGKSGMFAWGEIENMMSTIFHNAHVLSKNPHMPFTEKLRKLSNHLCELGFNERLQKTYESSGIKIRQECKVSTASDWWLTTKVKYDHLYDFTVNDPLYPYEIYAFGIWLVDGSEHVLKSEDFNPTNEKNNIMHQLGLPVWPLTKDQVPTENYENYEFSITLFKLATRLKQRYGVKHVNFIDLSCRSNPKSWFQRMSSWFVKSSDDEEMEDVPNETLEEVDVHGTAIQILKKQPRRLPKNWKYAKILRNSAYVYANLKTGEMSPDFPKYEMSRRPRKRTISGVEIERVSHPSIPGTQPVELPLGWKYLYVPSKNARLYVNERKNIANPDVPKPFSRHGGKITKSRKRKCLRSRTESRKKRSS